MAHNENLSQPPVNSSKFGETNSYFTKNVLPNSIQAHESVISKPSSYIHNTDNTFILVTEGTGTVTVNGLNYALKPDTLVNLGTFHVYRFTPDAGQTLKIMEARINNGAYLYLIANPYFKISSFSVPSEPPILHLKGLRKDIVYDAMEGLVTECKGNNSDRYNLCFCYISDLFGVAIDARAK